MERSLSKNEFTLDTFIEAVGMDKKELRARAAASEMIWFLEKHHLIKSRWVEETKNGKRYARRAFVVASIENWKKMD